MRFLSELLKAWPGFSLLFTVNARGERETEAGIVKQKGPGT